MLLKQLIEEWIGNKIERALSVSGRENERKPGHQEVMEAALKVVLPNPLFNLPYSQPILLEFHTIRNKPRL
jgi:hypothetical protein